MLRFFDASLMPAEVPGVATPGVATPRAAEAPL
jgi:hypothetical protein